MLVPPVAENYSDLFFSDKLSALFRKFDDVLGCTSVVMLLLTSHTLASLHSVITSTWKSG
jgi:hypothetical protein